MKAHGKHLIPVIAIGALALFLSACGKPEGPAEKAGKEVDKAVQSAGQKIEQAGEKIQETAKDASK